MVAAAVELVFVAGNAIMKGDFACQSTFRQQLQRPINRRESDFGIFFSREPEKLIGGKVVARLQEGAQNRVALVRMLQTHSFQVLVEDVLGLAHGFTSGRCMIVNSSLQHGEATGRVQLKMNFIFN